MLKINFLKEEPESQRIKVSIMEEGGGGGGDGDRRKS